MKTHLTLASLLTALLSSAMLALTGCADSSLTGGQVATPAPIVVAQAAPQVPDTKPTDTRPVDKAKPKTGDAAPVSRPKADRTPRKPGEAIRITFDHIILGMQKDMVFRPWMLNDDVKELDGQRVSITGVMNGSGIKSQKRLKEFVLLRNAECKFGPGGQADHLAMVTMKPGSTIDYSLETVRVEGTLRIKPETGNDGNTWSIYELEDATAKIQQ